MTAFESDQARSVSLGGVTFQLHPLKGANDIEFGMTADMVRARMTDTCRTFDRWNDGCLEDMYHDIGAAFSYDQDGHLEACEFFRPARALLGGIDMLALTMPQTEAIRKQLDPSTASTDIEGPTAYDLALGPWIENPDGEGDKALITTFVIGKAGYYDEFRPGAPEQDLWELADGLGEVTQEFVREYLGECPLPKIAPRQE